MQHGPNNELIKKSVEVISKEAGVNEETESMDTIDIEELNNYNKPCKDS